MFVRLRQFHRARHRIRGNTVQVVPPTLSATVLSDSPTPYPSGLPDKRAARTMISGREFRTRARRAGSTRSQPLSAADGSITSVFGTRRTRLSLLALNLS